MNRGFSLSTLLRAFEEAPWVSRSERSLAMVLFPFLTSEEQHEYLLSISRERERRDELGESDG